MNLPEQIKAAGVVGEGGAGFPTHVKLSAKAECFIVNAAECEPLIETDKFLIREFPERLIKAVALVGAQLNANRLVIAIKGKYKAEIAALEGAIRESGENIEIFKMPTFYPAGDEQIIVNMVLGRTVPERGIPLDVGAVVDNVGTLLSVLGAAEGKPVTEKYLSVTGAVNKTVMLKAPVGTPVAECIAKAGALTGDYGIILGGPMMGRAVTEKAEIEALTVTKTTGNILVLPKSHYLFTKAKMPIERVKVRARSACIQCRMCTDLCPRYRIGHQIRPHLVMRNLYLEERVTDNEQFLQLFGDAANCSDCGACEMFSCPMQLSPRRVNGYIKAKLRERGIQVPRNMSPKTREGADISRIPTGRLVARLGLGEYYHKHLDGVYEISPKRVTVLMQQHIGKPAAPVKRAGESVLAGEIIAEVPEGALGANIHASISGVIESIDERAAVIAAR